MERRRGPLDPLTRKARLKALRAQPAFKVLDDAAAEALAAAMEDHVPMRQGALLWAAPAGTAFRLLALRGQLAVALMGDGRSGADMKVTREITLDDDDSTWARVHVPGRPVLVGGALLPVGPAAAQVDFEALVDSVVYRVSRATLEATLAPHGWAGAKLEGLLDRLAIAAAFEVSPDLRQVARSERRLILDRVRLQRVAEDTVLQRPGQPVAQAAWVVDGAVELTLDDEPPIRLGLGDLVGVEALARKAASSPGTVVAQAGARLAVLDRFDRAWPPAADVWRLRATAAWFADFADSRGAVEAQRMTVVNALAAQPDLQNLPRARLHALLQGARQLIWRVGLSAPSLIHRRGGYVVVLEGEMIRVRERPEAQHRRRPPVEVLEVAGPGQCAFVGDASTIGQTGAWRARLPAKVVYISRHRCDEVAAGGGTFHSRTEERQRERAWLLESLDDGIDIALVAALNDLPQERLSTLATGLAARLKADFDENTLVACLSRDAAEPATLDHPWGRQITVPLRDGHPLSQAKAALAEALPGRPPYDQVFVIPPVGTPPRQLGHVADRAILVDDGGRVRLAADEPGLPYVYAPFDPNPAERVDVYPPSTVRFPFALSGLDPEHHTERMAALARAISGRRVGVALGGGGAWGYMHLAVLYHMERRGLPVDMVSGASFGAVVGSYYAAKGVDGLIQLLHRQWPLLRSVAVGAVTGKALQAHMDAELARPDGRFRDLRETAVPFFPACTDLVTASQTTVLSGSMGRGVRASGSLPPFFAPTFRPGQVLLDGALSANVPAQVLENEGAELIVASEVIPATRVSPAKSGGGLLELARDLNLAKRALYSLRGVLTLAETASEMSATVARVVFSETGTRRVLPTSMANAEAVIDTAVSDPGFWNTMRRLETMWTKMKTPRSQQERPGRA